MSQTNNLHLTANDHQDKKTYSEVGSKKEDFIGVWHNAIKSNNHIDRIEIVKNKDGFYFTAYGGSSQIDYDWGNIKCSIYSSRIGSSIIEGFMTSCNTKNMQIQVAGNVKYGILVVQTFNVFKDNSDKNNYFTREFFHKKKLSK